MDKVRNFGISAAAVALAATAMAPTELSAQNERTSPVPGYHLLQLSVDPAETPLDDFKAKTAALRSCDEAMDLAKTLNAEVTRNRFTRASQLPQKLQTILAELPAGQATPVFGSEGEPVRVLVLCNRV